MGSSGLNTPEPFPRTTASIRKETGSAYFNATSPPPFQIERKDYPSIAHPLEWQSTKIHLLHPEKDLRDTPDASRVVVLSQVIKVHFPIGDHFYSECYKSDTGFAFSQLIKVLTKTAYHALKWAYRKEKDEIQKQDKNNGTHNNSDQYHSVHLQRPVHLHRHVHKHVDHRHGHHRVHKHVNYNPHGDYCLKSGDILTTGNCVYVRA